MQAKLTIRDEQMEALRSHAELELARRVAANLRRHFAAQFHVLGDAGVLRTVVLGVDQAASHGLAAEREIFLYASLMFMLGSRFDVDPQLPWVPPLLAAASAPTPFGRIQKTYDGAMDYLDRVVGEDDRAHLKVLARLRKLDVDAAASELQPDFESAMIRLFHRLHPRKAGYLGEEGMRALVADGSARAARSGIFTPRGVAVHLVLMLMLGSAYATDPQFPWAIQGLSDTRLDEGRRVEALLGAAMDYLDRSLAPRSEKEA